MRQVHIPSPGVAGLHEDVASYQVPLTGSQRAYDAVAPFGLIRTRGAWTYDDAFDINDTILGIARDRFALADATRTTVSPYERIVSYPSNAQLYDPNYNTPTDKFMWLRRCVYRDEAIYCNQAGGQPLVRYSGSDTVGHFNLIVAAGTLAAGQAMVTLGGAAPAGAGAADYYHGAYLTGTVAIGPYQGYRILETTGALTYTLEGVRAVAGNTSIGNDMIQPWAFAYPAVDWYSAGTITSAGGVGVAVNGTGVNWNFIGLNQLREWPSLLVIDPSGGNNHENVIITAVPTSTQLTSTLTAVTNANYAIMRQLPFTEAKVWRGCLFGLMGADSPYPNRLYYGPPDWNLSFPPGAVEPFDPTAPSQASDPDYFRMGWADVPNYSDSDPGVAILTGPDALYVLKRDSIHQVTGNWPNFSQRPVASGVGCIDIRSAIESDYGLYFASERGVHRIDPGGRVVDLMDGRLEKTWRNFVATNGIPVSGSWSDMCLMAVHSGYLHVHLRALGVESLEPYWVMNLTTGAWESRFRSCSATALFTSRVPGEEEKLFAGDPAGDTGRVADYSNLIHNSGGTDAIAGATTPAFYLETTAGLAQAAGIEGEARMADLDVHAEVENTGTLTLAVTHAAGLLTGTAAARNKTVKVVTGAGLGTRRYHGRVDRSGRQHTVKLTGGAGDAVAVAQIAARFRDSRAGS